MSEDLINFLRGQVGSHTHNTRCEISPVPSCFTCQLGNLAIAARSNDILSWTLWRKCWLLFMFWRFSRRWYDGELESWVIKEQSSHCAKPSLDYVDKFTCCWTTSLTPSEDDELPRIFSSLIFFGCARRDFKHEINLRFGMKVTKASSLYRMWRTHEVMNSTQRVEEKSTIHKLLLLGWHRVSWDFATLVFFTRINKENYKKFSRGSKSSSCTTVYVRVLKLEIFPFFWHRHQRIWLLTIEYWSCLCLYFFLFWQKTFLPEDLLESANPSLFLLVLNWNCVRILIIIVIFIAGAI